MPDSHPLVCRFGALGDMVLITPLLRQLYRRSGLPCDIVASGGWNKLLFQQMPYVRNVFSIDSRSAPYWFNRSQRDLVAKLHSHQHQYVWVCETSQKSYRLLARAGIERDNSANQLDLAVIQKEHYCDKWLRLGNLSPQGFEHPQLDEESTNTELFVSEEERLECRQWLQRRNLDPDEPIVCIQAGSKRTSRRGKADRESNTKYWPEQNWVTVIDGVIEQLPTAQILLCGVPAEIEMCQAIESLCHNPTNVQTVADDLPLRRLLALLCHASSCISVDTGPAHAAAALDCPLVVLFGKASPNRFRPVSSNSPVQVIVGRAGKLQQTEADIAYITPQQVLEEWNSVKAYSQ
ncbi:MAG: glycosyltransferase family 9 protein [Gammaproteobacteria bacterium]|nr:glycosyltransferase family 9 protein [Gammaproteobacteria bacterium]